ncbi:hypothetical protein GIB67_017623 [Kingdonia uniflora]|uniref:Protein CHROMATIN REMODELING 25 n=1 Tax=Kingdonia uniflora TaxID=39325 RepID=A0A7J7LMW2_9MAGN|nr:hypothetical protein GIB67_017623 [Kingdonia uniflora]
MGDDHDLSVSNPSDDSSEDDNDEEYRIEIRDQHSHLDPPSSESDDDEEDRKSQNVSALIRGDLVVKRQSLIPRVLTVSEGAAMARKPFKPPFADGYNDQREQLVRRLNARKRFVPWGSTTPILVSAVTNLVNVVHSNDEKDDAGQSLPPGIEPLVLWQPEGVTSGYCKPIAVDHLLVQFLRPHQREGVQFMFDCVSGLTTSPDNYGCILADDMGLGKTLQSITLLYTLLRQGFDGEPLVKKAIIVTPTSLVSNWESEIKNHPTLCKVLIVSYETFRMHSSKFDKSGSCDLLICDEAHRLKNDQTLTNRALAALSCRRRILLSGTPMQARQHLNDLEEFFAMVNFTNPGVLGDVVYFRRYYETPIVCGREPTATKEERKLGDERSAELSAKMNQVKRLLNEEVKQSKVLAYITALKKLCNHPKLIYDTIKSGSPGTSEFQECIRFFPAEMFSGRSGSWTGGDGFWVELSGKMHVLARLLAQLRQKTDDRIVLVSNYTQTLDLFAQLCRERRYPYLRLDGSTSISKRQKLVVCFNDTTKDEFVFLLSSKAGGCGLNLIGGNRLVLFDPDWNPANDKQAAARVWRDGQKKRVYIYRFLSTGTIEEKVYQRQMSKEGLQKVIQQEQNDNTKTQGNLLSTEDLRDLFTFNENIRSEIHDKMNCNRCKTCDPEVKNIENIKASDDETNSAIEGCEVDGDDIGGFAEISGCLHRLKSSEKQLGSPLEEDLGSWGHHLSSTSVPDAILQAAAGDEVTFVFTNQVDGKLIPIESTRSKPREAERSSNHSGIKIPQNRVLHHRLPLAPLSSYQNSIQKTSPASSNILEKGSVKLSSISPETTIHVPTKPRTSLGSHLPLKRPCPASPECDDFM